MYLPRCVSSPKKTCGRWCFIHRRTSTGWKKPAGFPSVSSSGLAGWDGLKAKCSRGYKNALANVMHALTIQSPHKNAETDDTTLPRLPCPGYVSVALLLWAWDQLLPNHHSIDRHRAV